MEEYLAIKLKTLYLAINRYNERDILPVEVIHAYEDMFQIKTEFIIQSNTIFGASIRWNV